MCLLVFFVLFGVVCSQPQYVTRKFCKDVDQSQCTVFSVVVDPCDRGPAFCNMKKNKKYGMTLDLMPKQNETTKGFVVSDDEEQYAPEVVTFGHPASAVAHGDLESCMMCLLESETIKQSDFSAQKLKLSIAGDVKNDGNFSTDVQPSKNGCGFLSCPLEADERRIFDVNLILDKRASGKFPVKVKLWNEENETQACCYTFMVKVK